jgi:hypothetical protein
MFVKGILLLLLVTLSTQSSLIDDFVASLPAAEAEVDKVIIRDFLKERHRSNDVQGLVKEFSSFKKEWTERMVEFLIRELEINE